MYITRDIEKTLAEWKEDNNRKPLILRGVRQCGKTSVVRKLGEEFDRYVEINLEKQPGLHLLFEGDIDISAIVARIELETETTIEPGRTLLFIDEIQECPRAITTLRYFYEDMPNLHIIAAGSLLEFVMNDGSREHYEFPVGRVRSIYMYPLSFNEFLRGTGKDKLCDYLNNTNLFDEDNMMHNNLIEEYKKFLITGGMPEAVAEYIESGSFLRSQMVHRDIISNMMDDFNKYSRNISADSIRSVFEYALRNSCVQTKASSAIKGMSGYIFDECIKLLGRAGLVHTVKASSCDSIPIGASKKETNKKLLVFDTGIYLTENGLDAGGILAADAFDEMNKGSIVELQTGLEMLKYDKPYIRGENYYWYRTGANAEVDYVIQDGLSIIPVEVKASKKGSMQSLRCFLRNHESTPYGIRISLEDFTRYDDIVVYPVYAVKKIKDDIKPLV